MRIVNPEGWMPPLGYSNVVIADGTVNVAGQIGWDPTTGSFATASFSDEVVQALRNVVAAVTAAGSTPASIVRMTWYVTDMKEYRAARRAIAKGFGELFGDHHPAITLVAVTELVHPDARVEIDAVASDPDLLRTEL